MLDIGWSEMAIILLVALIVIGPKDLPRVARTVGRWAAKGRALAREFQNSLEEMARETELDKVKTEIEKAGRASPKKMLENTIDPTGDIGRALDPNDGGARAKPKRTKPKRAAGGAEGAADADAANGASPTEVPTEAKRSEVEQVRRPEPVE
jgi:sec-independent protein translocase protein TatB